MEHNKTISENAGYMNFIKKLSEFLLRPFCKNFVFFVYIFSHLKNINNVNASKQGYWKK